MLQVEGIRVSYGGMPALHDVSLRLEQGEIVTLVGSNGAGKSTTVRTISGLMHPERGQITFMGRRIDRLSAPQIVHLGIAHVPEGRQIFGRMTVLENLMAGAFTEKSPALIRDRLGDAFKLFPILEERQRQQAGTLSGGQQQMLAIARGLMCGPKLLMLDEPSLGIAPNLALQIIEGVREIRDRGVSVLLIEQDVHDALRICDRGYVLQTGRVVAEGRGSELLDSEMVRVAYLGM